MLVCIKNIPKIDGGTDECICLNGKENFLLEDFLKKHGEFIASSEVFSKILQLLRSYPDDGKIGIAVRVNFQFQLLTVGFVDLPGDWDPCIPINFFELESLSIGEIRLDIIAEFGAH